MMKAVLVCAGLTLFCSFAACTRLPVQEDFDISKYKGLWYGIAAATNYGIFDKKLKCQDMCSANMKPRKNDDLAVVRTTPRAENCKIVTDVFKKTDQPGIFHFHSTRWGGKSEISIVDTDYDNYSLMYVRMTKDGTSYNFIKLLGRKKNVDQTYKDKFGQLAKKFGLAKDTLHYFSTDGMCPPPPSNAGESVYCKDYSCIANPTKAMFYSLLGIIAP